MTTDTETTPSTAPEAAPAEADALDLASLPDLSAERAATAAGGPGPATTMDLLSGVELDVTVELGRRRLSLGEVAQIGVGSVVELDTLAGEPLAVFANGRRIATGEAVVVEGQLGVRIRALADRTGG
jgi:flagellar motor switch protein FliN/FliY